MSTFMRLSAAAVSVIVISAVVGFELGAAMLPAAELAVTEISNGPGIASPGAGSRENMKTRSIAGYMSAERDFHSLSSPNMPAANPVGPSASDTRQAVPAMRALASACLIASN